MYEMAKQAREKMKAKAKALAAPGTLEKGQATTQASWTPAEALNADVKTGMRPISQRQYKKGGHVDGKAAKPRADRKARKSGGKVETEIGVGMANKNMKEANKDRPGIKHVGALKRGGAAKRASGGLAEELSKPVSDLRTRLSREDRRRKEMEPDSKGSGMLSGLLGKRHGGKIKRAEGGGILDKKAVGDVQVLPKRGKAEHYKKGGKIKRDDGGRTLPSPEEAIGSEVRMKGLKVLPSQSATSEARVTPSQLRREEGYSAADMKASRAGRKDGGKKWIQEAIEKPGALRKSLGVKEGEKIPAKKLHAAAEKGGKLGKRARLAETLKRLGKATGGSLMGVLDAKKKSSKKSGKKGGKTDINIVINAAKHPSRHMEAALPGGDAGAPPLPPMPPAPPMPMPPAPPMGAVGAGAPPPALLGRKAGGRITKVAKSYKDMEAGAGSGEGRLQKTDIAKLHKDAPARKAGGRISRIAKSYKDMTAGAASGEGRLQKEDIAKAKVGRSK